MKTWKKTKTLLTLAGHQWSLAEKPMDRIEWNSQDMKTNIHSSYMRKNHIVQKDGTWDSPK